MDTEKRDLWDRLDNEPERAYRAFVSYLDLPSGERTLLEAYRGHVGNPHAAKPSDTWSRWSGEFAWRERAAAHDEHLACIRREARERAVEEEAKKHAALVERHRYEVMEELTILHDGVMEYLENLDWTGSNIRPQDIIQILKLRVEAAARFEAELPEKTGHGAEWTIDAREFADGVIEEILAEQDDETPDEEEEDPGNARP